MQTKSYKYYELYLHYILLLLDFIKYSYNILIQLKIKKHGFESSTRRIFA